MIPTDFSSILLLLIGKESHWTPFIILGFLIFQKWDTIERKIKELWLINKIQYELTGKMYCNANDAYTYGDLSTYMWAVLYDIHKIIKKNEVPIKKAKTVEFPSNNVFENGEYVNIPADDSKIKVSDSIYCTIQMKNKDIPVQQRSEDRGSPKDMSIETINLKIVLTSSKSILDIMEYIKKVTDEYNKQVKTKTENQLFIIKPQFMSKSVCSDVYGGLQELTYPTTIPFKSTKKFDNLFFEGKETLIKRLDSFVQREKYASLGLPETLGLLFYGEPGTGKTSAIKAVAHYLQMHLIIVPMNHIKTKKRLEELFFSQKMDDYPQQKRIYVFEEIDCNGWEDIVRDRRLLLKDSTSSNSGGSSDNVGDAITTAVSAIADSIKNGVTGDSKNKKKEEDDKLTLGAVLEVIDGLVETPGRVIIFTTNHKEHLDSALLRPGRIDMQIEFKKLRRGHIADIYKKWYGYPICSKALSEIPDYKFTQAEISQLLFRFEADSDRFLNEVSKVRL